MATENPSQSLDCVELDQFSQILYLIKRNLLRGCLKDDKSALHHAGFNELPICFRFKVQSKKLLSHPNVHFSSKILPN